MFNEEEELMINKVKREYERISPFCVEQKGCGRKELEEKLEKEYKDKE